MDNNVKAFKMIQGRFSDQVKLFNAYDVSGQDSGDHYFAVIERIKLAKIALERAPELRVTTLARSLGDIYLAIRNNLIADEFYEWNRLNEVLEALHDKYGI
jgi:hypothetical protein